MQRMKFSGRAQICVGDTTSHGGVVIEGSPSFFWNGISIARKGDKVTCPKCKPYIFQIAEGFEHCTDTDAKLPMAMEGHRTTCGAVLIARSASVDVPASASTPVSSEETSFDEQIQAVDKTTGKPLAEVAYFVEAENGKTFFGETDATGHCPRVQTEHAAHLKVWLGVAAIQRKNQEKK